MTLFAIIVGALVWLGLGTLSWFVFIGFGLGFEERVEKETDRATVAGQSLVPR